MTNKLNLERFASQRRSLVPTPVHFLERLSARLGARVWIKRDDLTGFAFGGNKTRKLDFLVAEAVACGADTLVGMGGLQSNFCRILAAAGAASGMEVHLILGGSAPALATANLRIDHLLGARIRYVASTDWSEWDRESRRLEQDLVGEGRTVYRMPMGGSVPLGALGYVEAFFEMLADAERLGIAFDTIIHASGSGGTQAGLLAGQALAGWRGRVVGMSVAKPAPVLHREVAALAAQTASLIAAAVDPASVHVDDAFLGGGYRARTRACVEAAELLARECGVFLDHVYTGKAAAGLLEYARSGRFRAAENVLFLHTGGNLELFE